MEPNRLAIFKWVDGYGTGAIEWLSYSDSFGSTRTLNLTLLARRELGLGDYLSTEGKSVVSLEYGSSPDMESRGYDNIIGSPVAGFEETTDSGEQNAGLSRHHALILTTSDHFSVG